MNDDRTFASDDPISRSLRSLLAKGLIVDSGERRDGQIVWVATRKMADRPSTILPGRVVPAAMGQRRGEANDDG
jgi:hypothetical protein